ncbi:MAG: aminoacyl-histidine dipeptidase [bacterium]|nr:aminoacyl-histidine dipeptidase [bacterium]
MDTELNKLYPVPLWLNFETLCSIPHPSKHEEAICDHIADFGRKLGLETVVDEAGNILISKPAAPGYENRKKVTLQAHVDMVTQKNSDTLHDFEKDPILAYIDDEWVTAHETTLGGDNGIGVAAIMAILESGSMEHGPLEALFTVDEETGMTGVFALKQDFLSGDILINLDSEEEGELYIGCAGGIDTLVKFPVSEEKIPRSFKAFRISLTGLKGGHSGVDIGLGRSNAIKLVNRFFWEICKEIDLRIASIEGGNARNAIPREAFATVAIPEDLNDMFLDKVSVFSQTIKSELSVTEPDIDFALTETALPESVISRDLQSRLVKAIHVCPNGVISMNASMPGVVETSTNLGIIDIKTTDGNRIIEITIFQRSSVESLLTDIADRVLSLFELAGGDASLYGRYPGWNPNVDSPVLKVLADVYEKKYNKIPEVKIMHAGLECGIISAKYANMDTISLGPTIRYPHSPDEKVHIESVGRFWDFLVESLKNI